MSIEARIALCDKLIFQDERQRTDLLDIELTRTGLVALLLDLVRQGWHIEITAIRSDHRDDSALGRHSHARGFAADLWPLRSASPGDYLDANTTTFGHFLRACATSPWLYQVGLAGSAQTEANMTAAGPSAFADDGADHIHLGAIG